MNSVPQISELASELGLSQPTIHGHVNDMLRSELICEAKGWRKEHPAENYYQPNFPVIKAADGAAFRHGERSWMVEGKRVHYLDVWSYTEWFNLLGNPGAVVPVSHSVEGLPIGVQIVGRPWEEEQVLAVAAALEKECNAWKIPPIS